MIQGKQDTGFTVAELMIATTVFAVILLVGAAAFLQLGRSYYKGVTVTQTQQVAKQIMSNVTSNIRLSSNVSGLNTATSGRYYYCVGGHRYSFKLFGLVDTSNHDNSTKFGLIADEPNGNGCGNPFDSPTTPLVSPTELLANNMRLLAFSITPVGASGTAFSVSVTVAFGQDSVFDNPNSASAVCQGKANETQFCAITHLNTVVYQGASI